MDSSGTLGDRAKGDVLKQFKKFSKQLVRGFSITQTAARVAVVTYSEEAKLDIDLGSGQSYRNVERTIDDIKLSNKPDRNLEEALTFARDNVFSLKGGLRKVCVIYSLNTRTMPASVVSCNFLYIVLFFCSFYQITVKSCDEI